MEIIAGWCKHDMKEVAGKLIPDNRGKDRENPCYSIDPLPNLFIRKVKILKKPRFESRKPMELHGEGISSGKATEAVIGANIEPAYGHEPPAQESV